MIGKERQKEVKSYIKDEDEIISTRLHRMSLLNQWSLVDIIITRRVPERKLWDRSLLFSNRDGEMVCGHHLKSTSFRRCDVWMICTQNSETVVRSICGGSRTNIEVCGIFDQLGEHMKINSAGDHECDDQMFFIFLQICQ